MKKNLLSILTTTVLWLLPSIARAQTYQPSNRIPVADNSQIGTQVSGTNNNFNITGGLQRGQNLFHSFADFSIPTGGAANFTNPAGNQSIITRVTGNLFSDLNGTLNTNGANFLLINPNGVVFGSGVKLDVGKAFAASTANGIDLVDGKGGRYTFGTNGNGDAPLLTIDPNVFLNISHLNMGASVPGNSEIVNYGTLQTNNDSQYIGLIGGNVKIDGGKIIAPGGRVDLGGLNSVGSVSTDSQGLVFGGSGLTYSDVSLTNGASVSVRANQTLGNVNVFFSDVSSLGSSVNISANNLNILNSGAKSATEPAAIDAGLETNSGIKTVPAGDININDTGGVNLDNADIQNTIRAGTEGNVGTININTPGKLSVSKSIIVSAIHENATGNTNGIKIAVGEIDERNGSFISSQNLGGKGNAGNIKIDTTRDISLSGTTPQSTEPITQNSDSSSITSTTSGQGNAGNISINTNEGKLVLSNQGFISSGLDKNAVGNAGDIAISVGEIDIRNQSKIESSNGGGKGNAGNIKLATTGNITISGTEDRALLQTPNNSPLSLISSSTFGTGDAGKITIDTKGKLSVSNRGEVFSLIYPDAVGNSQGIKIAAGELELANGSTIQTSTFQSTKVDSRGNAGDIDIKTTGNLTLAGTNPDEGTVGISSNTVGKGNAGKITIDTKNKLSVTNGGIFSSISNNGEGTGGAITIEAGDLTLNNTGFISSSNSGGVGNAGAIYIKTTGNLAIAGKDNPLFSQEIAGISSNTSGKGDAGKITIDTKNKLFITNGSISSDVAEKGVGTGGDITIVASDLSLITNGNISSINSGGVGNSGNIDIKTRGDLIIVGTNNPSQSPVLLGNFKGISGIYTFSMGKGNAGKITIESKGKLSLDNTGGILNTILTKGEGNSLGIKIDAGDLSLINNGIISSGNVGGGGNAGDININTTGNLTIVGTNTPPVFNTLADIKDIKGFSTISNSTYGKGNAGQIIINTQGKLSINNFGSISSTTSPFLTISPAGTLIFPTDSPTGSGNSLGIKIFAGDVSLKNKSSIQTISLYSQGNAGNITIASPGNVDLSNNSDIQSGSFFGTGQAANISISSQRLNLNKSAILSVGDSVSGGNITISNRDLLLLRNGSEISTTSDSKERNSQGGNITINSPLIVATPLNGSNKISANANGGNGGNVKIESQGLFGIQYRPKGQESPFTNDITASSTFGQNGNVNITTPGVDPGKDTGELPAAPNDASNQISQTCGASQQENKFYITGRGGLPPNASEPQESEALWQDAREVKTKPATTASQPQKYAPPAIGWVFQPDGRVRLIAAQTAGGATGTKAICPGK